MNKNIKSGAVRLARKAVMGMHARIWEPILLKYNELVHE